MKANFVKEEKDLGNAVEDLKTEQGFIPYVLPADAIRHLPLLIEAAKGIVNVYSWRGKKGYQSAMAEGVMELRSALAPLALVDGSTPKD